MAKCDMSLNIRETGSLTCPIPHPSPLSEGRRHHVYFVQSKPMKLTVFVKALNICLINVQIGKASVTNR